MPTFFDQFITDALGSDVFAAGIGLGLFGLVAALLRRGFGRLSRLALRRAGASLELDNRSAAYRHLMLWMEQNGVFTRARHVRLTDDRWAKGTHGYAPAPGRFWFIRRKTLCLLERDINEKARVGAAHNSRPMETIKLTVLFGKVSTLTGWIGEGRALAMQQDRIGPGLHILKQGYWEPLQDIPGRAIETVLVDDDRVQKVLEDMRWFYGAREWYAARGVPWRRGYLVYGPPGTGKSSLIRALATELSLDIASLDIGHDKLTDDDLREALIMAPKRALVAIEDIDAVFTNRESGEKRAGVSFSGLLNAIDGVAAQEGRALIMTTNHKEKLDPALIRPGRADLHVELGLIAPKTAARLFARFFPSHPALAVRFQDNLGEARSTPAAIQGWLLSHSTDPEEAATAKGLLGPRLGRIEAA